MTASAAPRTGRSRARRGAGAAGPPRQARAAVSSARAPDGAAGTPGPYLTRSSGAATRRGRTGTSGRGNRRSAVCVTGWADALAPFGRANLTSLRGCDGGPAASSNRNRVTGSCFGKANLASVGGSDGSPATSPDRSRVTGSSPGSTVPASPSAAPADDPRPGADSPSPTSPTLSARPHSCGEASPAASRADAQTYCQPTDQSCRNCTTYPDLGGASSLRQIGVTSSAAAGIYECPTIQGIISTA